MSTRLSESLHQLMHAYRSQLRDTIRRAGIDWPVTHIRVLKGIAHQPGCTAREIAGAMRADKAQITRALGELRDAQLIESQHNPNDRRSQLLQLTATGRALRLQLEHAEEAAVARLTDTLNADDLTQFMSLAQRMITNVSPASSPQESSAMPAPAQRQLEVIRTTDVSPHMKRVTLGGLKATDFPTDQASAYFKFLFPREGHDKPLMRTYTIRHQRDDEIDVDFALHEPAGLASHWAQTVQPGERIDIRGPGPKKMVNFEADWFLLVGDMTSLPAISVNLEQLPDNAQGHVVLEVTDNSDIQPLQHPPGVKLHWVIAPSADPSGQRLVDAVKQLPWLTGTPSVWAACEFNSMRALRQHFRETAEIPKSHFYISSYWKMGVNEDDHKTVKRQDTEQWEQSDGNAAQ
ncbi:SIP domain-containing protein [Saccharospirillum sp. MSK14-1]|uniref:SIP domain-containing protein n=1 Tax=Saccharospirillum sp. MSK14-1 TaxID=1897632 RepID=UPI000D3656F1|nr:SIP domain-containing protein [Saccharospirillum sp. MSK14-1]